MGAAAIAATARKDKVVRIIKHIVYKYAPFCQGENSRQGLMERGGWLIIILELEKLVWNLSGKTM
jgi:hypothetical protein